MSYVKDCIYCGQKIRMDNNNTSSKWTLYEVDTDEIHECKNKQKQQQQQPQQEQNKSSSSSTLTLEQRVRRIEQKLGIML